MWQVAVKFNENILLPCVSTSPLINIGQTLYKLTPQCGWNAAACFKTLERCMNVGKDAWMWAFMVYLQPQVLMLKATNCYWCYHVSQADSISLSLKIGLWMGLWIQEASKGEYGSLWWLSTRER